MFGLLLRWLAFAVLILPAPAVAEPIKLKLAFHTSDKSNIYQAAVKPFVEAVNAEGRDIVQIEVYFSGALGRALGGHLQLLQDGTADIAFVIPGLTPARFGDTAIVELPGLYRSMREATLVFTRLVAARALRDYDDFFTIGAYAVEPENIHTRPPIASLDDLRGKRVRVNNPTLVTTLGKLGMTGVVTPVNLTAEAISSGKLDGAVVPVSPLFEYGIGRVATYHYLLPVSASPLVVLMNRKTFDGLPRQAQDIIRKYGGEWAGLRFIETFEAISAPLIEQLKADPKRKIIIPSEADAARAATAFKTATEEIIAGDPHRRELLTLAQSELVKLRSSK